MAGNAETTPPRVAARTVAGVGWMVAMRLSARALDFVALLVLARILTPLDFGLVALAMSLIYIVEALLELPLNQVLMQLNEITSAHLDTAFTLGLLRGLIVAAVLAAIALPFSYAYHDPRLFPLIAVLSLAPAARGLGSPGLAIYSQEGLFGRDFVIELSGKLTATVLSVTLAATTGSYWALAAGTICAPVMSAMTSYVIAPARVRLSLAGWRDFSGFIGWTTGAQVLVALNWQADRLIMGRTLPTATVGRYAMASDLSYLPDQMLLKPIARPVMAGLVRVRHDRERLRTAYSRVNRACLTMALPIAIVLATLASPLLRIVLGEKWAGAGPLLTVLALSTIGGMISAPLNSLALALGRPSVMLKRSFAEAGVKLPILVVGLPMFGIAGALTARAASSAMIAAVSILLAHRLIGFGLRRQLLDLWRPVAAVLPMTAVNLAALPILADEHGLRLVLGVGLAGGLGGVAYAGTLLVLAALLGAKGGMAEEFALRLLSRRRAAAD